MLRPLVCSLLSCLALVPSTTEAEGWPRWAEAHREKPPMTVEEARAFMRRLAEFCVEQHMKRDGSPQRGMLYEYVRIKDPRVPERRIEGEALDTMHDGAWFACALVRAARATGEPCYRELLRDWLLPFYLRMLNRGDELFTSDRNDAAPERAKLWAESKEWLLQGREKGFVPYWWDDGASVSLDMLGRKDAALAYPGRNEIAGADNPKRALHGYSLGSSNHLAQDLGVMLQLAWLLFRESHDEREKALAGELAVAARHLQECRARHGHPRIPAVVAPLALASGDSALRKSLPEETWRSAAAPNPWHRATVSFKAGQRAGIPGFADDQEYRYHVAIAREGTLPAPVAFRLSCDAFTIPQLFRAYCDDAPPPPGLGPFDLHPIYFIDGKPADLRSQRKGPRGEPRPAGSRLGPQLMVVSGWALQALKAAPGLWEEARAQIGADNWLPPGSTGESIRAALERELGGGLRTWEAVFEHYGYVPTCLGAGNAAPGVPWEELSDTGAYAHLISAAAQWILHLENRRDWEEHRLP